MLSANHVFDSLFRTCIAVAAFSTVLFADEISPRKDFTGTGESGEKVACKYLATGARGRSSYDCVFATSKVITAIGRVTGERTWCAVVDGRVAMMDCLAGRDFANYFIYSNESSTGLLSCRLDTQPPTMGLTVSCAVHNNPSKGIHGAAGRSTSLLSCSNARGDEIRIDASSEEVNNELLQIKRGQPGALVYNPTTRAVLALTAVKRGQESGKEIFQSMKDGKPDGIFALVLPERVPGSAEAVLGHAKIAKDGKFARARCTWSTEKQ